ncbi:MAG: hypothetical protein LBC88_06980 [Spirochaetaceae bacterium]|jgi:hypothetical protein|nr:hypothetical protein [Spirochaetaceae bacterium]
MIRKFPVFVPVLVVLLMQASRAGTQEQPGLWVSRPIDGSFVVIGVSAPRRTRNAELERARNDAADKALFYYGVRGKVAIAETTGPGGTNVDRQVHIGPLDPARRESIRAALTFNPERDVTRTGTAVFVRFSCPAPDAARIMYPPHGFC